MRIDGEIFIGIKQINIYLVKIILNNLIIFTKYIYKIEMKKIFL